MPTYEATARFLREYERLTEAEKEAFDRAVGQFVVDLRGNRFRKGLRVKGIQGHPGIYEMTWADDGRATFQYGRPVRQGEAHIIWRRVGHHDILRNP